MKTTYYLGAGASAEALPCVAGLSDQISQVFQHILHNYDASISLETSLYDDDFEISSRFRSNSLHDKLNPIRQAFIGNLSKNLSIDTLAKIYYLNKQNKDYLQLKAVLTACFLLWDHNRGLDKRYTNFWATITKLTSDKDDQDVIEFSDSVNIISWNYDNQVEKSLGSIFDGYLDVTAKTNIPYSKLNGSASLEFERKYTIDGSPKKLNEFKSSELACLLAGIIVYPEKFKEDLEKLRFCWEKTSEGLVVLRSLLKSSVQNTGTLVVIGYSFPSINHSLDREIINSMTSLRKVYFQGCNKNDSSKLLDYFKAIRDDVSGIELIPIESAGFFIPPEVTLKINLIEDNNDLDL